MQTCDTVMKSKSESFYFVKQVDKDRYELSVYCPYNKYKIKKQSYILGSALKGNMVKVP